MDRHRKFLFFCGITALSFPLAVFLNGCVTRSQAKAQAEAAYIAGQRAAFAQMAAMQHPSVTVNGPVENHEVEWTNGLTLARAIVQAKYTGPGNPKAILLTRQGHTTRIDPQQLLAGHDVPLQPGDTVTIQQ